MSEEFLYPEFETKWSNSEIIDMLFDWAKFCMKNKTGDLSNDTAEYFSDKLKAKIAVCSPDTPPTTEEAELWMDVIDIVIKTDGPAIPLLQDEYSIRRRSEQNSEAIEFSKEKVTELVTLAYKEGFSRNGRPLGEWGDHYNENEAELKEYIDQLFKQKQSEPEPATPGQWYARLEGCKTPEDVDELEKRHVDVINANPDLRRLFVIYKLRLKKNLS